MKQEFITSKGKIVIERDILFIRNLKFHFTETIFFEIVFPVAFSILIVVSFILSENQWDYFRTILYTLIFGSHMLPYYKNLFKKSFASRIPLNRIKSFEMKPDAEGLETEVIFYLKNGRYRSIFFRTLENQYQPFTEFLSQTSSPTQLAFE